MKFRVFSSCFWTKRTLKYIHLLLYFRKKLNSKLSSRCRNLFSLKIGNIFWSRINKSLYCIFKFSFERINIQRDCYTVISYLWVLQNAVHLFSLLQLYQHIREKWRVKQKSAMLMTVIKVGFYWLYYVYQ